MDVNYKGYTIKIERDEFDMNPRKEFDNMGRMVCCHSQYDLGDEQLEAEEIKELIEREDTISLPLFLYDHSGITMNTTGFSCPWDSGQVGIIYMTLDQVRHEYGNTSQESLEKALKYMKGEVKDYDDYLTGNVWGYIVIDSNGDELDSCWGFFGDPTEDSYIMIEAKEIIDWHIENEAKKKMKESKELHRELVAIT